MKPRWWMVTEVSAGGFRIGDVAFVSVEDNEAGTWRFGPEDFVRRTDPTTVHHKDEFIGMAVAEARVWAAALGWAFRDHGEGDWFTDDLRRDRINVWADTTGSVVKTEMY